MCDLSEGVYNDGFEEGYKEGYEEGYKIGFEEGLKEWREKVLIELIPLIMTNLKLSAEKAMEILDIPEAEWPEYKEKLNK